MTDSAENESVPYSRNPKDAEQKIERNKQVLDETFDRSIFDEPE